MKLHQILARQKFTLVVSLPANDLSLAEAALAGGADAVKVHANVWHRASGHTFGTYEENKPFLQQLIARCGPVPVGLVPGGEEAFISAGERLELEEMGLDFFSSYLRHLPPYMMESQVLTKMPAIDSSYNDSLLEAVRQSPIDVLECSVQPGELYGQALNYEDVLRYGRIVAGSGKPCLIPTQKAIRPEEVRHLYEAGCKAVMIGAIVMGKDPTPQDVQRATHAFKEAILAL